MKRARLLLSAVLGSALLMGGNARHARAADVDRTVVRFSTSDIEGLKRPHFISERVLAFEARLEALADPERALPAGVFYRERHIRSAIERHIAETILANLELEPKPNAEQLRQHTDLMLEIIAERVGGRDAVEEAARAEGLASREVFRLGFRAARAALYIDRSFTRVLNPPESELLSIHRLLRTPFSALPFSAARARLAYWHTGRKLNLALSEFYDSLRPRLKLTVINAHVPR